MALIAFPLLFLLRGREESSVDEETIASLVIEEEAKKSLALPLVLSILLQTHFSGGVYRSQSGWLSGHWLTCYFLSINSEKKSCLYA